MPEQPFISVIVPVFNEADYIRPFLQCLLEQDYPSEKTEFLLVDGGSRDGTVQVLQEFVSANPCLKMLSNPFRYVPHALNIGLERSRGRIIIRMDVHAKYPRDYLSSLVYWLQETAADNVGGIWWTQPAAAEAKARAIAKAVSSPFGVGNAVYRTGASKPMDVDTVPFGCYWRDVFSRIGFFDQELLRNQDDEFNSRLIQAGGKIVLLPQIRIDYYARSSLRSLAKTMQQYGYFKPLVHKKLGRAATWRQFAPPLLILALIFAFLLAWILPGAGSLFGGLCLAYLVFLVLGALRARTNSLREGFWMVLAMVIMHFAYGWGYLCGMLVHWVLRKRVDSENPASTR